MKNNYFTKLIRYINNVYQINKKMEHVTDKRVNPTFKTSQIINVVLMGFLLRVTSFNQLNLMIKTDEFDNLFAARDKIPKIDAIRNSLKSVDVNILRSINQRIIKKACRNKVLEDGTIDGNIVVAIDGTSLFNTKKIYCDDCIIINKRGKIYYSYSCVVMSLVGDGVNLVIDYEMIKHKTDVNDTREGELITAKRLLNSVVSAHKGMIDVIAYDALACNSIFINHCLELGVHSVIRVKKNSNLSIREIKRTTNKKDTIKQWVDGNYSIKAYESAFHMNGVVQPLRYVKFAKKHRDGSRSQVLIVTTTMNMSIKAIYRIMKSRWNIENRVFTT